MVAAPPLFFCLAPSRVLAHDNIILFKTRPRLALGSSRGRVLFCCYCTVIIYIAVIVAECKPVRKVFDNIFSALLRFSLTGQGAGAEPAWSYRNLLAYDLPLG